MEFAGFWDDPENSSRIVKEVKGLKDTIDRYNGLERSFEDIETLLEMAYEEEDASLAEEIGGELDRFIEGLERLRIETLLSGPYDRASAILRLNAGAGGTESCD